MELDVREGFRRGNKVNLGTGGIGFTDFAKGRIGHAVGVALLVDLAIPADGEGQRGRQGVDHRHTYAVQTAGDLVGVVVELTTGVQHSHDDLGGRNTFLFMNIDRNTATVVLYGNGFVGVDDDADFRTVTSQSLIDGVIHQLKDHVMQAGAIVGITDVHTGPFAHRVESFEDFDTGGIVVRFTH